MPRTAFILCFLLVSPSISYAESTVNANELAQAINSWTKGSQWRECGRRIKNREERATEYANKFIEVAKNYKLSPVMMSAIVEQESGYDECQIGKNTKDHVGLPVYPTYKQIALTLGTKALRKMHGIDYFDAGAAQFLWPCASAYDITKHIPLSDVLSMEWSIEALGKTLARHRDDALSSRPRGYIFLTPTKHLPIRVSADKAFFIHHNSPNATNHRYFWNVRARGKRLWEKILELRSKRA
jgi:hypothetical protein